MIGMSYLDKTVFTLRASPLVKFVQKIYQPFYFHIGRPILITPEGGGLRMRKDNHQNWMRPRGLGARGIQSGQYAAPEAKFVQKIYQRFDILGERPILITPEGGRLKMQKREIIRIGWHPGVWVPGAFKLDYLQPLKPNLSRKFTNFLTFLARG